MQTKKSLFSPNITHYTNICTPLQHQYLSLVFAIISSSMLSCSCLFLFTTDTMTRFSVDPLWTSIAKQNLRHIYCVYKKRSVFWAHWTPWFWLHKYLANIKILASDWDTLVNNLTNDITLKSGMWCFDVKIELWLCIRIRAERYSVNTAPTEEQIGRALGRDEGGARADSQKAC